MFVVVVQHILSLEVRVRMYGWLEVIIVDPCSLVVIHVDLIKQWG